MMWFPFRARTDSDARSVGRCLASLVHTPSRDEPAKYWPHLSVAERSSWQLSNTDPLR